MSTVRAEDGFVSTFVIAVFLIPFMVLFFLIEGIADHRKYSRYQAKHLKLLHRQNLTAQNTKHPEESELSIETVPYQAHTLLSIHIDQWSPARPRGRNFLP